MKKPYYLYTRKRKDGKKVFYVKFRSPEGEYLTGKSTGETDQSAAEAWAIEQIVQGRVRVRADIRFDAYAKDFFRWEGPYVKHLRNRGRNIGKSHAKRMNAMIENHLNDFFGKRKLSTITNRDIERWQDIMLEKPRSDAEDAEPLSPTSINHSLICLRTILKQAVKDGYINSNPCQGIEKLATRPKGRGALSEEEATKLFADPSKWNDLRHYWICRLSYETGMRFGEVVALKRKYVETGWINVVHSWGRAEGLKNPKTRKSKRRLKVSTQLTSELKKWMRKSPFKDPEDFVFYTPVRELPYIDNTSVNRALYNQMNAIGISEPERKKRNIVFHSLRHSFNTIMRNQGIPDFIIQAYMGHSSPVMTDNYTDVVMTSFDDVVKFQERMYKREGKED
jgi:integrase